MKFKYRGQNYSVHRSLKYDNLYTLHTEHGMFEIGGNYFQAKGIKDAIKIAKEIILEAEGRRIRLSTRD